MMFEEDRIALWVSALAVMTCVSGVFFVSVLLK
jgi:hypothetical protein